MRWWVVVTMVVVLVNLVVVEARRRRPGGSCGLSCYRSLLARSPPQTNDLLFLCCQSVVWDQIKNIAVT